MSTMIYRSIDNDIWSHLVIACTISVHHSLPVNYHMTTPQCRQAHHTVGILRPFLLVQDDEYKSCLIELVYVMYVDPCSWQDTNERMEGDINLPWSLWVTGLERGGARCRFGGDATRGKALSVGVMGLCRRCLWVM